MSSQRCCQLLPHLSVLCSCVSLCLPALPTCSDSVAPTLKALGLTPLMAAVLVGAAQNVFSKSAKYSLFDPCKEMAYIPLDDEVGCTFLNRQNAVFADKKGCLERGVWTKRGVWDSVKPGSAIVLV